PDHPEVFVYTVRSSSVQVPGSSPINYTGVSALTLTTAAGSTTVNVLGTPSGSSVTVNAGAFADFINVGNAGTLNGLFGSLTVNGNGGTDLLTVNDQGTVTPFNYTLTATTVQRGGASVTYGTVEGLTLTTGTGGDVVNVRGTAAAT